MCIYMTRSGIKIILLMFDGPPENEDEHWTWRAVLCVQVTYMHANSQLLQFDMIQSILP